MNLASIIVLGIIIFAFCSVLALWITKKKKGQSITCPSCTSCSSCPNASFCKIQTKTSNSQPPRTSSQPIEKK